ncbi:MAG: DUF4185 domain-containing protein [Spirochaetota bacterium]|nr:DUF4185 domain-containing protein [Spirochaetota bacterium]
MKGLLAIAVLFSFLFCGRVEELGIFGESRKGDVLGQDGITPIILSDSIVLWTFGDTILGTWKGNISTSATFSESVNITDMISNSLAFSEVPTPENVRNLRFFYLKEEGRVCQFLKYRKDENPRLYRLWPVDGVRIDNRVYIYYYIIKMNWPTSFHMMGVGIAVWNIPNNWNIGDDVEFKRLPNLFPSSYPAFGATVLRKGNYIYTAGHYKEKDYTSPIKIARVDVKGIENRASYDYLTRDGNWVKNIENGEPFLGDVMGECSISYNENSGMYVIIYCQTMTGRIIMVAFSDFRELYKSQKRIIYEPPMLVPNGTNRSLWYYSGKEIFSSGDLIFVIYINPLEYQPYLLKLTMK